MESEVTESALHRYLESTLEAEDPDDKDFYIWQALQHVIVDLEANEGEVQFKILIPSLD